MRTSDEPNLVQRRSIRRILIFSGLMVLLILLIAGLVLNNRRDTSLNQQDFAIPESIRLTTTVAGTPVISNTDWTPVEQMFNGVPMMLVPAGCFIMGSDTGNPNEAPAHEQCFDEPFWIDKYEVTNAVFGSEGYFTGDQKPRVSVTWLEANDHCDSRNSRLPTEREWEYAARGPNSWIFPWGDEFDASNLNFCDAQCELDFRLEDFDDGYAFVADVGAFPSGQSWVGAQDMAGNVWEWVSSIYIEPLGSYIYPYDAEDGRENDDNLDSDRVLRGGGWGNPPSSQSSAFRATHLTDYSSFSLGFRCARSAS